MRKPQDLSKDQLLQYVGNAAKLWLAHDGLWFLEVEKSHGIDSAIALDINAWQKFTVMEAQRIMELLQLPSYGGIPVLAEALQFRLYAHINEQELELAPDGKSCILTMKNCRVQSARIRKGMQHFPCKSVGLVEYAGFAATIDPAIKVECMTCPPDAIPNDHFCKWKFKTD